MAKFRRRQLVVCIDNEGYPASLEKRKLYVKLVDPVAAKHGLVRVIDESGEDYLFSADWFVEVKLPRAGKEAVLRASNGS